MFRTILYCAFTLSWLFFLYFGLFLSATLDLLSKHVLSNYLLRSRSLSPFDLAVNKAVTALTTSPAAAFRHILHHLILDPMLLPTHSLLLSLATSLSFSHSANHLVLHLVSTVRLAGEYCSGSVTSHQTHELCMYLFVYNAMSC